MNEYWDEFPNERKKYIQERLARDFAIFQSKVDRRS